ncbi:Succinate-semialdehyde dehydrogenase (NADP+) [Venustampulla echinocandica]|uniref:succinate-semialdehyde dehydrogenase [NAD(P)(+)] n=1 Tax=Venustampulla echinocandica TaxID=2656787 RepID=A0A370TAQ7_9HELO|nr:Succinate-semialdehyde dehydrogenase (NADP+) [Venustampulla echinocandica]RDL30992.1 Succinate-semialdehyde dehydrogenase (NADP+) [Venustampulla echinocandica]
MASILCKKIPYTFKDISLLDNRSFIAGQWVTSSTLETFPVYDPEDNEKVCDVADLGRDDTRKAVVAAQEAFKTFKNTSHRERRWLMRRWADMIKENKEDLAAICTLELGKPFSESLVTVKYGTDFLDWFEGAIERQYGETIPAAKSENRIFTIRQPQGVVAAITPWNSPIAMVTRKVGAAIAAGNTVVCKPAPETSLCAIAVAKLFERAGGPPGVFNIVTSSVKKAAEVGQELTSNPFVRHLSFTGSTAVGRFLHAECAKSFKKTSMELGGNAPFIVFGDAKIDRAVEGLISSKFRSSGQTCVCANRIFIHSSIIEIFASVLQKRLGETFRYGSVWDKNVNFGPLYSNKALEKIHAQIKDALEKGGKILGGGKEPSENDGPNFFPPTIITGAKTSMLFMEQETFGPLAFLVPFDTDEEVIALANDTDVGLAAYFYTENISRVWKVSEALETGMVGVRVGLISACEQPFGGIKNSGTGREGGREALDEYTEVKSITVGV